MAEKEIDDTEDEELIPTEEELKAKAAKLSVEEITAGLKLIRELLDDKDEDVTPEDRKILVAVHDKLAKEINKKDPAAVTSLESLPEAEFARMCWGHPCTQNISRRAKSLSPKALREAHATRGTHNKAEYKNGRYNYNFIPKTVMDGKHKVAKMRTSSKRWAAASLILAIPSALPGIKNPALNKWKSRRKELVEAKGQLFKLKKRDKERGSTEAAASETVILVPRIILWDYTPPDPKIGD